MMLVLLLFKIGDQHAELRAPVAHMVSADHVVAQKRQGAHRGVADNGGADVADMHLFRHVRRGVVDDDGLRLNGGDAQARLRQRLLRLCGQPVAIEKNIDEAWPGDLCPAGDAFQVKMRHHAFSQLSRRLTQLFRDGHNAVRLIIPKLNLGGLANLGFTVGRRTG